jgi:hypothetical protein
MREAAEPALPAVRSIAPMCMRVVMALRKPSSLRRLEWRNPVKPALTEWTHRF